MNRWFALSCISALSMAAALVLSVTEKDWMWSVISILGMIMMLMPAVSERGKVCLHAKLTAMAALPFFVYIMITAIQIVNGVEHYRAISLAVQTFACMACGYAMLVNLDVNTDVVLSKRWLLVFSLTFACAFTVIYVFVLFPAMEALGYPLYNYEFEGPGALDNTEANRYQMMPMAITTFASIAYAALMKIYLSRTSKEDITAYYGGE